MLVLTLKLGHGVRPARGLCVQLLLHDEYLMMNDLSIILTCIHSWSVLR